MYDFIHMSNNTQSQMMLFSSQLEGVSCLENQGSSVALFIFLVVSEISVQKGLDYLQFDANTRHTFKWKLLDRLAQNPSDFMVQLS